VSDAPESAREYQSVLVSQVAVFDAAHEDEARRFIALVDELYDRKVNLVLSAAAAPQVPALDVNLQDDDLLDPAAVPLDRVQHGPARLRPGAAAPDQLEVLDHEGDRHHRREDAAKPSEKLPGDVGGERSCELHRQRPSNRPRRRGMSARGGCAASGAREAQPDAAAQEDSKPDGERQEIGQI